MRKRKLSFKVMLWLSLVCMLFYIFEPLSSLYISTKVYAATTPQSEDFDSVPTGTGVSVPQTIGDWTFSMFSTVGGSPRTQIRMLAPNTTKDLLFLGSFQAGMNEYGRVQSNTGAFKLVSFRVVERNSTADTYRIVGYLGGIPVVGAEKSFTPPPSNFYTVDVSNEPAWQNIDEFRIYANATVKLDFDDLIVTDPVVADSTAPIVGNNGTITTNNVTASGVTLDWTKATDDFTSQEALEYRVYQSSSDNIDAVSDIEANGTPLGSGFTKDISSFEVTDLDADTTYYFNVIVKDAAGNKSVYKMQQVNTMSVAPGVTVTIGNVTAGKGLTEEIPVSINTPVTGIGAYGIQIDFDPAILEILEVIPKNLSEDILFESNINFAEGWLRMVWLDMSGGDSLISTATELFKIKVKVKSDAELGNSSLTIDKTNEECLNFADSFIEDITADAVNGTVNIVNSYIVDFNVDGGSSVDSQLIIENGKASKPAAPTRNGYTFKGWYIDHSFSEDFDFNTLIDSNKTLYAKWTANSAAPTVSTDTVVSNLTSTGATVGGNVTSDGHSDISERGFVYSKTQNPTTNDTKVQESGTTGTFSVSFIGLEPNTTYYFRAYATNSEGTSYGSTGSFRTKNINANLSDLTLSHGTLDKAFSDSIENYSATVASTVTNITINPTKADSNAQITVNGNSGDYAVLLHPGKNTVTVKVTAEDSITTKTYTITVYRLASAPNVTADDERNIIEGISTLLEYQIDEGPWTQYNPLAQPDLSGNKTVKVRIPGSNDTGVPPSEEKVLTFTKNLSQPNVTTATTEEDTLSSSGLVIIPDREDSAVTHFKISEITGGTLYKNDGATEISDGSFIENFEGEAGLRFKPVENANSDAGDTFSFKVQAALDETGRGLSKAAVAIITVSEVNDPPVAQPDYLPSIMENSPEFSIPFEILLENDSPGPVNESKQKLTIVNVSSKKGGTARIEGTNVIFTPDVGYRGPASFIYTVRDNGTTNGSPTPKESNVGVAFTIEARADQPTVTDAYTNEDEQTIDGLVISPTNDGGVTTTHYKISNITGGRLYQQNGITPIEDGAFITVEDGAEGLKFSPFENGFGTTGFGFLVQAALDNNGKGLSNAVEAKIIVKEVNDSPIAVDDQLSDKEMNLQGIAISFDELLQNDRKGPENENDQILSIFSVDNAVGGIVNIQDGGIIFTPVGEGSVSFEYTVKDNGRTDGKDDSKTDKAKVSFNVVDNRPPAAPNVSADDTTNKLLDADNTMEFSTDNGTTWTSYDSINPPTFNGDVTVQVRVKTNGNKPAGIMKTVIFTKNPIPVPTPSPTPSTPTTEQIVVDVDGNDGTNLTKTPIERTTEPNGTVKDKVSMSDSIAKDTVAKAKEIGMDTARIIIPDKDDKVSEVKVEIPNTALKQLNDGNLKLEIVTENGVISIPKKSISDFKDDLYFRVVPIKSESEKKKVEERAKTEELVKEVAKDQTVQVLGRPMEIETNMQSREVSIALPLKDSLPADTAKQQEILENLGVFIEHSDGTKELIPGKVVKMQDGTLGLQFTVTKFSTFTMIYMDGWEEYQAGQKVLHTPYIHGTGNGNFAPNANVTRAQMAAMLARNLDKAPTTNLPAYQDVSSKHWAYADILEAKNAGIMLGVSTTKFDPEGGVTRSQMASIAYRWIQAECKNDSLAYESCAKLSNQPKAGYTDVTAKHWAAEAINFLKETEIMVGYDDGNFHPEEKLTRAQAVKVLNRLFKRGPLTGVTTPTFKDVPTTHWAFDEIEEAAREHKFTLDIEGKEVLKK